MFNIAAYIFLANRPKFSEYKISRKRERERRYKGGRILKSLSHREHTSWLSTFEVSIADLICREKKPEAEHAGQLCAFETERHQT
jgi:hypothetical protein